MKNSVYWDRYQNRTIANFLVLKRFELELWMAEWVDGVHLLLYKEKRRLILEMRLKMSLDEAELMIENVLRFVPFVETKGGLNG